jgi:hypothetical protein
MVREVFGAMSRPRTFFLPIAALLLTASFACTAQDSAEDKSCDGGKCDSAEGFVGFGLHYELRSITDWAIGDADSTIQLEQYALMRPDWIPYITIDAVRLEVPADGVIELAMQRRLSHGAVLVLFEKDDGGLQARSGCFDVHEVYAWNTPDQPRFFVNGLTREMVLAPSLTAGDGELRARRSFAQCEIEPGDRLYVSSLTAPSSYPNAQQYPIADRYATPVTASGFRVSDAVAVTDLAGLEGPSTHVVMLRPETAPADETVPVEVLTDYRALVTTAGAAYALGRGDRFSAAATLDPWRLILVAETTSGELTPLVCNSGPQLGLDPEYHHETFRELAIDWDEGLLSTSSPAVLDSGDATRLPAEFYYPLEDCGLSGEIGTVRVAAIPDPTRSAPSSGEPNLVGEHEVPLLVE